MRFSFCQQLVYERGLFVRQVFIPYEQTPSLFDQVGYGSGLLDRAQILQLFEMHERRPIAHPTLIAHGLNRTQGVGFALLEYHTAHISVASVYAWQMIAAMRVGSRQGRRYRQALPVHGQRTRSNAKSVRRGHASLLQQVRELAHVAVLTRLRRAAPIVRKGGKGSLRGKAKVVKKATSAKKKKLDVWR